MIFARMNVPSWNPDLYADKHGFVSEYGRGLLGYLPEQQGLHILDLGCGTGTLTHELAQRGHFVIGVDNSESMLDTARTSYPELEFVCADACNLPWTEHFDIVFSNAVFHWILDQKDLLKSIHRALKPNGQIICEMGCHGNIAIIEKAFRDAMEKRGLPYERPFCYPTTEEYSALLEENGFCVDSLLSFDRPTLLNDGEKGLRNWMMQFFFIPTQNLSPQVRESIFAEIETSLRPQLWDGFQWTADYVRLRIRATKEG